MERSRTHPLTLSVQDVAAFLNVDERTIRRGIERGQVPGKKIGRIWRIPRTYVLEFTQPADGNNEQAQADERSDANSPNRHSSNR